MSKRDEILDEEGNVLPPPEPGTDAAHIIYLLEYGRKRGFRIGPVLKVGSAVVQVLDLRQDAVLTQEQKASMPDLEPGSDMAILLGGGVGDE